MPKSAPRLVVGVDGTGHSDGAVRAGFEHARRLGGELELLHVAEVPFPLWQQLGKDELASARSRTVDRLAGLLAGLGVAREELDRRLSVRPGAPARELLAAAEGAAWIFAGAHHRQGRFDFGNNLRGLLAHAPCPVWIQPGTPRGARRVLAASDLSEHGRAVLAVARDVAVACKCPVEVLHVFARPDLGYVLGYPVPFPPAIVLHARETAERELAQTAQAIDWKGVNVTTRFIEGDPARELLAAQEDGDLLVLGTHGHTALMGAILGGVTRSVLSEVQRTLIVVRAE
jgi:nucleotide-binding universal stress UspA family protein